MCLGIIGSLRWTLVAGLFLGTIHAGLLVCDAMCLLAIDVAVISVVSVILCGSWLQYLA